MSLTRHVSEMAAGRRRVEYARLIEQQVTQVPARPAYEQAAMYELADRARWWGADGTDEQIRAEMERSVRRWLHTKHMGDDRINRILSGVNYEADSARIRAGAPRRGRRVGTTNRRGDLMIPRTERTR